MDTQATSALGQRDNRRRVVSEARPVVVQLRENKPKRNELLAIVWERLDGVRKTSPISSTIINVHLEEPQDGASQAAAILHEYLPLIHTISDDATWDKCTMVSYETLNQEQAYDVGIPLNEFHTFGSLIVEMSELLSEETGYPALYFLLLELVYREHAETFVYSMTDIIPDRSEEFCSFSFRMLPDDEASDYYNALGGYMMKYDRESYDSFRHAADMVLQKGEMDHHKLLAIASFVTHVGVN